MAQADDEMFAGMIAAAIAPNAREITAADRRPDGKCPCGSNLYAYNLFDYTGKLLMYCCHSCEKPRRAKLEEDGKRLTEEG